MMIDSKVLAFAEVTLMLTQDASDYPTPLAAAGFQAWEDAPDGASLCPPPGHDDANLARIRPYADLGGAAPGRILLLPRHANCGGLRLRCRNAYSKKLASPSYRVQPTASAAKASCA